MDPRDQWLPALALAAAAAVAVAGCNKSTAGSGSLKRDGTDPIRVVCTTGMVADLVRNVGGDQVQVTHLMAAGVDPHTYTTTTHDVSALKQADMVFYSGLHLEANFVSVFNSLAKEKPVYAVADEIERWHHDRLIKPPKETYDPHIWFDVSLWKLTAKLVADRLGDFDPANARTYAANAAKYMNTLDKLHEWCRRELDTIPTERRVMVTAHDAFSYFGRAYGVEVKAIQGVSTAAQASIAHTQELIDEISRRKIKAVFVETSVNPKTINQLIEGCAAKGHTVARGGELFSDAMGKDGTPEGTYEGMIRHNVTTIAKALK